MKLNFVQDERELETALEVCEAGEGNSLPREVWIIPPTYNGGDKPIWCAVDNVDGHAWTEDFVSLDGALVWALGIGEIDDREEYDLPGHATFRHRFVGQKENLKGEGNMEKVIEIPADAKTVTLALKKTSTFTLRAVLPQVKDVVELVIEDAFETSSMSEVDRYRVRDVLGERLMEKLERSRVVDGEFILDLVPTIEADDTGAVRLFVRIPVPGKEG